MKIKSESGITGIDISISIIIIFIFVSIIATLSFQVNNTAKSLERRGEAIGIAIQEIEQIKNKGFENYQGLNSQSTTDNEGNNLKNQPVNGKEGYYKTIKVQDYTELEGNGAKIEDLVKKVTLTINYKMNAQEQSVELTTILSKEN